MAMDGVYAVVNARGGGEDGRRGGQGAVARAQQGTLDDGLAGAEWLVAEGYTRPGRLGVGGASNGGLMAAACVTQRPDLFGAAIVESAPLDMLRFHEMGIGRQWVCEYGSPDD